MAATIEERASIRKTCKLCGQEFGWSKLVKSGAGTVSRMCLACNAERNRTRPMREALGHDFVTTAPDPRPAVALRERLARARAEGVEFDEAWLPAVVSVVTTLDTQVDQLEWRCAFLSQERAWRAGYNRVSFSRVSFDLVDTNDPPSNPYEILA